MKRALTLILMFTLLLGAAAPAGTAEGGKIPFETSVELANGAGEAVATLTTRYLLSEEDGKIAVGYTLTNHGEIALTQLNFNVTYLDADGNDLRGKPLYVMIGLMKEPVQPGESRDFEKPHYFDGAGNVAAVALEPIDVKDEVELPPWTEPQPGNLLLDFCNYPPFSAYFENLDTNPPVLMHYHVDQSVDEDITDVDVMLAEIESLRNMRVGEETDICITDSGISYWFTMADGTEWGVSFEAPGIFHWHGKNYNIIND